MDLIMKNLSTGEEVIVPYDFDFNIGADGQADFEVSLPIDAEVWDFFYVDNYTRDNEYAGFVTDIEVQTAENQKLVKGQTIRYYFWSSVAPLEGQTTPQTLPGNRASIMIGSTLLDYFQCPLQYGGSFTDEDPVNIGSVNINRFDSCDTIIKRICGAADRVMIPRVARNTQGTSYITFTLRKQNTYYPRIDDGEVGGTGEATLSTVLSRKVCVIAGGSGEQAARTIRAVWWDGSAWHVLSSGFDQIPSDYEEYLYDYNGATDAELVQNAKEIAMGFWMGSVSLTASELEITPGATLGDKVYLTGAVEHESLISGMILRRENGITTEEFTYSDTEAETTSASVSVVDRMIIDDALSSTSENPVQNKVINAALTPTEVTGIEAGTNCSLGSHCHVWTIGKYCMVTLNLQITGSISSGATLVSKLPKNSGDRISFAAARSGGTQSAAMRIAANATTITADGAISQTGYYDAFFIYILA